MLRTILEHRAAQGDACAVYTGQPSYNDFRGEKQPPHEVLGDVEIVRGWTPPERKRLVFTRLIASLWFLTAAVIFAYRRRKDFDVVLANVHPPVLMGWALRIIERFTGLRFILHVQDIHPEASQAVGAMNAGLLSRFLRSSDSVTCRNAWRLIALSNDMARTLRKRPNCENLDSIRIINNFPLELFNQGDSAALAAVAAPMPSDGDERPFVVLFAGNLGRFQSLPRLVEAAQFLRDTPIEIVFMGTGAVLSQLKHRARELQLDNVRFTGQKPVEVAFAAMQAADLGVVSLSQGVCRVAYPSKSMTYLAAGLPLLALVEDDSDLAIEVRQHRLGYAPGQVEGEELANVIRNAWLGHSQWTGQRRKELAETAETVFGTARALRQWDEIAVEWRDEPKETLSDTTVRRAA